MSPGPSTLPMLDPNDRDDLIYYSRTGELSEFKTTLAELCSGYSATGSQILLWTIDPTPSSNLVQPTSDTNSNSSTIGSLPTGNTLLHYPAANGEPETLTYLLSILKDGTNSSDLDAVTASKLINHTNGAGNTALHWAAMNGQVECVKILVAEGADVGIRNAAGRDAVAEARESGNEGGVEAAEWLEAQRPGSGEEHADEVVDGHKKMEVEELVVDASDEEQRNVS